MQKGRLHLQVAERVIGATFNEQHLALEDFKMMPRGAQVVADITHAAMRPPLIE